MRLVIAEDTREAGETSDFSRSLTSTGCHIDWLTIHRKDALNSSARCVATRFDTPQNA